jgi:hypothetical protein
MAAVHAQEMEAAAEAFAEETQVRAPQLPLLSSFFLLLSSQSNGCSSSQRAM